MSKIDHLTLIHKALTGQIQAAEQQLLDDWRAANPGNELIAREIEQLWQAAQGYKSGEEPDVEVALARLHQKKAGSQPVVRSLRPLSLLVKIAVAASFLLGLFFVWQQFSSVGEGQLVEVNTTVDQQETISLEDGSAIVLNESSEVQYPNRFGGDAREVSLRGEAFFDIANDTNRPFSVTTPALTIRVVGTAFNVFAYPSESMAEVVVDHGSVQVQVTGDTITYLLKAGDRLQYHRATNEVVLSTDIPQNAQAWRTGNLTFPEIPLTEICQVLERYFDIDITIQNEAIEGCALNIPSLKNPTREIAFKVLETMLDLEVTQPDDNTYLLSGDSCK